MKRTQVGMLALVLVFGLGCDLENEPNIVQPARGFYSTQTSTFSSSCVAANDGQQFTQFVRLFGTPLETEVIFENNAGDCQGFTLERQSTERLTWDRTDEFETETPLCRVERVWTGEVVDIGGDEVMVTSSVSLTILEGTEADCLSQEPFGLQFDTIPCTESATFAGMSVGPSQWPGCF